MTPSLREELKMWMESRYEDDVLLWGSWMHTVPPHDMLTDIERRVLLESMGTVQLVWHAWQDPALSWEALWHHMCEKRRRPLAAGPLVWPPQGDAPVARNTSARTISLALAPSESLWHHWTVAEVLEEASDRLRPFQGADVVSVVAVRSACHQDRLFRQALLLAEDEPTLAVRLDNLGGTVAKRPGLMVGREYFTWHDARTFMVCWDNFGALRDMDSSALYPLSRMLDRPELSLNLFEWVTAIDALQAPTPLKKRLQETLWRPAVRRVVASSLWWLNGEEEYNG